MSKNKRSKVIHVDKLVIHAKEVEVIQERKDKDKDKHWDRPRRDPWGFFWGRPTPQQQETATEFDQDKE